MILAFEFWIPFFSSCTAYVDLQFGLIKMVCFVVNILSVELNPFICFAVSSLIAFKRAIFEDPLRVLSDWNTIDGNPCNWTGIYCSRTLNRVITL